MNLNLIEMLTVFQFITIRNSSDGNNIKTKAIKRQVGYKKFDFYPRLSKVQLILSYCLRLSSALKMYSAALGRKRLCTCGLIDGNVLFCRICRLLNCTLLENVIP